MLLTALKSYDKSQFVKDVTAGIIVAIIALPLSIALALASGVGPEAGIFTAIVAGFVISALGGSSVQIAGPTAAFATIVAGIVARDGMDGLVIATVLAGVFLILKPDQIYSVHHYNRFYIRYRCYHCHRTVKGLFWCDLSGRCPSDRDHGKAGSISGKCWNC